MSLLVVGTVAFDSIRTPEGSWDDLLGGSATHASVAASFFTPVRLLAVVGEDFGEQHRRPLVERSVDLAGLAVAPGRTFRWTGVYGEDPNERETLATHLNVLSTFDPVLPEGWKDTPVVFLANLDPDLQGRALDQLSGPRLVAADTMNFWIEGKPEALRRVLTRVDLLLISDGEIRQLTGIRNLVDAAEAVRKLGPRVVAVKRGEHGVIVFDEGRPFALPAYPLRKVVDPTGAGDAFAGGFLGWAASRLDRGPFDWRRAAVVGSVMASFQVEDLSLERVRRLGAAEIQERYEAFAELTRFAGLAE